MKVSQTAGLVRPHVDPGCASTGAIMTKHAAAAAATETEPKTRPVRTGDYLTIRKLLGAPGTLVDEVERTTGGRTLARNPE